MKLSSISYYIREGMNNLLKNRLMSIASIATVAAGIFIITLTYCVITNLQYFLVQIEDNMGIVAFLEDDLSSDGVNDIRDEILSMEHIDKATFVSSEEALSELKEEWDASEILEGFSGENNPLSNSFEIFVDSPANQGEVISKLEGIEGIRNIRHAQEETEILLSISNTIQTGGVIIIVLLGIISIILITNTIKISVHTRRYEISIMKFVGATDWFIRWPFVIEGILIGVIGAAIPIAISWGLYDVAVGLIYSRIPVLENLVKFQHSYDVFRILAPGALATGVFLGIMGSATSLRKHLKV